MDKYLKTLIETAVAPIIALLTDINNKLGLVTGVAVQAPAAPAAPFGPEHMAMLTPSVPAAAVNVTPAVPASNITRESLGQALLTLAKSSEAGMAKAQGFLLKYVPADQEVKTLAFVPENRYAELLADITGAPLASTKAAESLV